MENETNKENRGIDKDKRNLVIFLAAVVVIVLATIFFRMPLLAVSGSYESDGLFSLLCNQGGREQRLLPAAEPRNIGWPPQETFYSLDCAVKIYKLFLANIIPVRSS